MEKEFVIRRMTKEEIPIAIDWAFKEGWNPGLGDAQCFYEADQNGFFIGLLDGDPIATGCAIAYDDHFAFCGLYIVKGEYRHHGYGIQLTQERLKYLGNRITGIDGVLENVAKYQNIGYVSAHLNTRYEFNSKHSFEVSPHIVDLQSIPFKHIEEFDRKYFPAPRAAFLNSWITQPNGYALGFKKDNTLLGYGVIRKCHQGYKIGPLFADSPAIAESLFISLCSKVNEGPIYLDIPEPNLHALALVKRYQMQPKFEVARMYRNGSPAIDLQGVFGVTTFELG